MPDYPPVALDDGTKIKYQKEQRHAGEQFEQDVEKHDKKYHDPEGFNSSSF